MNLKVVINKYLRVTYSLFFLPSPLLLTSVGTTLVLLGGIQLRSQQSNSSHCVFHSKTFVTFCLYISILGDVLEFHIRTDRFVVVQSDPRVVLVEISFHELDNLVLPHRMHRRIGNQINTIYLPQHLSLILLSVSPKLTQKNFNCDRIASPRKAQTIFGSSRLQYLTQRLETFIGNLILSSSSRGKKKDTVYVQKYVRHMITPSSK